MLSRKARTCERLRRRHCGRQTRQRTRMQHRNTGHEPAFTVDGDSAKQTITSCKENKGQQPAGGHHTSPKIAGTSLSCSPLIWQTHGMAKPLEATLSATTYFIARATASSNSGGENSPAICWRIALRVATIHGSLRNSIRFIYETHGICLWTADCKMRQSSTEQGVPIWLHLARFPQNRQL